MIDFLLTMLFLPIALLGRSRGHDSGWYALVFISWANTQHQGLKYCQGTRLYRWNARKLLDAYNGAKDPEMNEPSVTFWWDRGR